MSNCSIYNQNICFILNSLKQRGGLAWDKTLLFQPKIQDELDKLYNSSIGAIKYTASCFENLSIIKIASGG